MQNKITLIVDSNGSYLTVPIGGVKSFSNNHNVLEIITPFPDTVSILASYIVYDSSDSKIVQYVPTTELKAKDVLDPENIFYDDIYDWNVFQVAITESALARISQYRAGRVGISLTFSRKIKGEESIKFSGYFNKNDRLPDKEDIGAYYKAEDWNIYDKGILWGYGDIATYTARGWTKGFESIITPTETIDIPVNAVIGSYSELTKSDNLIDPSLYRDFYTYDEVKLFPSIGSERYLYLAKYVNNGTDKNPIYEDYNMLFRWDKNKKIYIPLTGKNMTMLYLDKLPVYGANNILYIIPGNDTKYEYYIWINNEWDQIGGGNINFDPDDYYTKNQTDAIIMDVIHKNILKWEDHINDENNPFTPAYYEITDFDNLKKKDENTLYFVHDQERDQIYIYKGEILVTDGGTGGGGSVQSINSIYPDDRGNITLRADKITMDENNTTTIKDNIDRIDRIFNLRGY